MLLPSMVPCKGCLDEVFSTFPPPLAVDREPHAGHALSVMNLPSGARSVAATLAFAIVASCGPTPSLSPSSPPDLPPSSAEAGSPPAPGGSDLPSASPSAVPAPGHELYGFVPYWEMDDTIAAHVAATPLSTVALFSVSNTSKGAINQTQPGYKLITGPIGTSMISAAHGRGTRVEIVFTSFGSAKNASFFAKPAVQDATIASLVAFAGSLGIDGVDVDVEGLSLAMVPEYGGFVGRLHTALVAANPGATVSVATGAGPTGSLMAAAAVAAGADRVFLMGYDYRTATSQPGATSPIERSDGGRSLTYSLDLYATAGVPPERLLLGLPLYGISWPVAGPVIGAPSTGDGQAWILRRHLDVLANPAAVPVTDDLEAVDVYFLGSDGSVGPPPAGPSPISSPGPIPLASTAASAGSSPPSSASSSVLASAGPSPSSSDTTWTGVYVDSPDTLARKLGLGETRGLTGAGFWAIGYERGLPGYTDLMTRFVAGAVPPS